MPARSLIPCLALLSLPAIASANVKTVCVDVQVKSWTADPEEEKAKGDKVDAALKTAEDGVENVGPELVRAPETANAMVVDDPYAIDPARYLDRMVRYEVTHEIGFEAVKDGCAEKITIELYPLRDGWTVFARYSGHAREEKVDQVQLDEFVPLSRRLARALLRDMPISDSLTRETVLRADSETDLRTIDGSGHFVLAVSGHFETGTLATTQDNGNATDEDRWLFPKGLQLGYRGKYRGWGVDFFARGALGSTQSTPRANPTGGHVDLDGSVGLGLHFLRYWNNEAVTSFYWGGGAQFKLSAYSIIRPEDDRSDGDRERVFAGGIDAELLLGVEFMRASTVHFYLQTEVGFPTYLLDVEVDSGAIDSYIPTGLLQVGLVF